MDPALERFRRDWQQELQGRQWRLAQLQQPDAPASPLPVALGHALPDSPALRSRRKTSALGAVRPMIPWTDASSTCWADEPAIFAPFHADVPDTVLLRILSFLDATALERAGAVCRAWHFLSRHPRLWRRLCFVLWPHDEQIGQLVVDDYQSDWHRMRQRRPYLRFDGIYAVRVTYLRRGQAEWTFHTPVQNVTYYRYLRLFPDGTVVWAMSFDAPQRPGDGEPSLLELLRPDRAGKAIKRYTIHRGIYSVAPFGDDRDQLSVAVRATQHSTFVLTMQLHRQRRRHLLQWTAYWEQPDDVTLPRNEFNRTCNDASVFMFVSQEDLR